MVRKIASWSRDAALAALVAAGCADAQSAGQIMRQAEADFLAGRIEESVAGFDQVARARPDAAPQFWQRGIALYYAGRYDDCRRQFEDHRVVNPNDVENAAWHFLCVARGESPEAALEALLPVGRDRRRPLLRDGDPKEILTELMELRDPLYREIADHVIETDSCSPRTVAQRLVRELS